MCREIKDEALQVAFSFFVNCVKVSLECKVVRDLNYYL